MGGSGDSRFFPLYELDRVVARTGDVDVDGPADGPGIGSSCC